MVSTFLRLEKSLSKDRRYSALPPCQLNIKGCKKLTKNVSGQQKVLTREPDSLKKLRETPFLVLVPAD